MLKHSRRIPQRFYEDLMESLSEPSASSHCPRPLQICHSDLITDTSCQLIDAAGAMGQMAGSSGGPSPSFAVPARPTAPAASATSMNLPVIEVQSASTV